MNRCKKWILVILVLVAVIAGTQPAQAKQMSKRRTKVANQVYRVVRDNWNNYGCYPSICIAIGVAESGLGEACRGWNMWGICQGRRRFDTVKSGAIGYMLVINNGYYPGAPHAKSAYKQLKAIVKGDYYGGSHSWYRQHIWSIVKLYNLKRYDKKMKAWLKRKEGSVRYE